MQSKQSNVTINESGITLHTGLSSRQFANAKLGQYVTEAGLIVMQNTENSFTAEEFRFTDTKTLPVEKSDEVVLINDSIKGTSLLSIIENDSKKALQTLETLSAIIEWSFESEIQLPNCGPAGTIITEKGILFLPFELFERSMFAQDKETTSLLYGCWVNSALNDVDSWRFTLSTYIYAVLAGEKPFLELDVEKRSEDYYDNNFIPINLTVKTNAELAKIVNHNLSLTNKAYTNIKPIKMKSSNGASIYKLRETTEKAECYSLPLATNFNSINVEQIDEKIIQEKQQFIEKKEKQLKRIRFFRKNKTRIAVSALLFVFVCFVAGSIIQSNLSKPTTEGMTEMQVVQTFYTGINNLDSTLLDSTGDSDAIKSYSNMVASLFVSGKMREAYEQTVPFLPPAQWIGVDNPTELFVFGLTHVNIEQHSLYNEKPQTGDSASFTVTFHTMVNQGLEHYEITESVDILTLSFGRKHWQITELVSETTQIPVDSAQFIKDVTIARNSIKEDTKVETSQQGILLSESLRKTYPWLPTAEEVKASAELIPVYLLTNQN